MRHIRQKYPALPHVVLLLAAVVFAAAMSMLIIGNQAQAQTPDVPAKPTGLSATSVAHNSVTLAWDDPGDSSITGYQVLRRNTETQAPGNFSTISSNTGSAATSYVDGSVTPETRYAYRVKAINSAGTSPQSGYVNVTTPSEPVDNQGDVPARPTGLLAAVTHDNVLLLWDDPDDDSITGYKILRRDIETQAPGTFSTINANTASADATYSDTGVEPETRYAYRVIAINEHGESPRSGYVNAETLDEPPSETDPQSSEANDNNGNENSGQNELENSPLTSATINADTITLKFLNELKTGSANRPAPSAFSVMADDAAVTVSTVALIRNQVTLTIASAVEHDQMVKISYDPPSGNNLKWERVTPSDVPGFEDIWVTNNTEEQTVDDPPTSATQTEEQTGSLDSATVRMDATQNGVARSYIILRFDRQLQRGSDNLPNSNAFTVDVDGDDAALSGLTLIARGCDYTNRNCPSGTPEPGYLLKLNMTERIFSYNSVKVSYDPGTANNRLRYDYNGSDVDTFEDVDAANSVPEYPPEIVSPFGSDYPTVDGEFTADFSFMKMIHTGNTLTSPTVDVADPVTGFTQSDIRVTGGRITGFQALTDAPEGHKYRVTIRPNEPSAGSNVSGTARNTISFMAGPHTDMKLSISAGAVQNEGGIRNNSWQTATFAAWPKPLLSKIEMSAAVATDGNAKTMTLTFSKPVNGFTASDVRIQGVSVNRDPYYHAASGAATATLESGTDGSTVFEVKLTPTRTGTVQVSIPAGAARSLDNYGNVGAGPFYVQMDVPSS